MRFLKWPLRRVNELSPPLPQFLITRRPFDANERLDPASALLLPSSGVEGVFDPGSLEDLELDRQSACLGLWMGTNFSVVPKSAEPDRITGWISNFPASGMYEDGFSASLSEVGLGLEREIQHLAALKQLGFQTMLTLSVGQQLTAEQMSGLNAIMLIVRSDADLKTLRDGYLKTVLDAARQELSIVIHGGPESHLPRDASALGIDAIMGMPSASDVN